jgi:hypothetical protein
MQKLDLNNFQNMLCLEFSKSAQNNEFFFFRFYTYINDQILVPF